MAVQIKFGTSGWRAVMAEDFTFANVRRSVSGIARYVVSQKPSGARVIVGRDPRFLGETFCSIAADVLAAHGITPLVIAEMDKNFTADAKEMPTNEQNTEAKK